MNKIYYIFGLTFFVSLLVSTSETLQARQFRLLNPIASPQQQAPSLPDGAKAVERVQKLERKDIEPLLRDVVSKWNTSEMANTISDDFYDKNRLMDVMDNGVPRNATLRIQSIQGVQTLNQYTMQNPESGLNEMISIVSATARTQLEYDNSTGTFVNFVGTNEFILKVTTPAN